MAEQTTEEEGRVMDEDQLRLYVLGTTNDTTEALLENQDMLVALNEQVDQLFAVLVAAGVGGITAGNTLIGIVAGRMMHRVLEPPTEGAA